MSCLEKKYWVVASLLVLAFCGCESTDITTLVEMENAQRPIEVKSVQDISYLDDCDDLQEGRVVYVKTDDNLVVCKNGGWVETDSSILRTSVPTNDPVVNPPEPSKNDTGINNGVKLSCPVNKRSSSKFCFDVIIRDFQANHQDFENFVEEYAGVSKRGVSKRDAIFSWNYPGYDVLWYSKDMYHLTCGNKTSLAGSEIGTDGLPLFANSALPPYLQQVSAQPALTYGECDLGDGTGRKRRGFFNNFITNPDMLAKSCKSSRMSWADDVYYTPGMVKSDLSFVLGDADEYGMLNGARIAKTGDLCDNQYFDQWFADVADVNKRSNTTLNLERVDGERGNFVVDYDFNNGGFFPLDSIDPVTDMWVCSKPCADSKDSYDQYGPQSLSIYCPPYDYEYASVQVDRLGNNTADLCASWLSYGGPRSVESSFGYSAAWNAAAAAGTLGLQHLRNYHFTVQAYAQFVYRAEDDGSLQFMSIDDMWVYVDGVLVHDGGGDHQTVPSPQISLNLLAAYNHGCNAADPLASKMIDEGACNEYGWVDGSVHRIWVFYANRQTDGSTFFIRAKI